MEHWKIQTELKNEFLKVVKDSASFNDFKRSVAVQTIIENTTYESGRDCLNYLIENYPASISSNFLQPILEREKIGNPNTYHYDEILGNISPTTIRYIMHASQIFDWFGSLNDMVVGEIGAGYGGLCTIINQIHFLKKYILFDIPEVAEFQINYINTFDKYISVSRCKNIEKCPNLDLLIAFCSWSEFDDELKLKYIESVINKAKMGIIGINWNYEANLKLLRDNMPSKNIEEKVPGFIVTFGSINTSTRFR